MSAPSYEDLLRDAAEAQRKRDAATQQLKQKKKEEENEKRRALVNQHKRPKANPGPSISSEPPKPAQLGDMLATYKIPKKPMTDIDYTSSSAGRSLPIDRRSQSTTNGNFQRTNNTSNPDLRQIGNRSDVRNASGSRPPLGNERSLPKTDQRLPRDTNSVSGSSSNGRLDRPRTDIPLHERSRFDQQNYNRNDVSTSRSVNDRSYVRSSDSRSISKPESNHVRPMGSSQTSRSSNDLRLLPPPPKPPNSSLLNGAPLPKKTTEPARSVVSNKSSAATDKHRHVAKERPAVSKHEVVNKNQSNNNKSEPADDFFDILSSARHVTASTTKPVPKNNHASRAPPPPIKPKSSLPPKPVSSNTPASRSTQGSTSRVGTSSSSRPTSNATSNSRMPTSSKAGSSASSSKRPLTNNKSSTLPGPNRQRAPPPPALSFEEMMRMAETNVKVGTTPLNPPKVVNNSRPAVSSSSNDKSSRFTSQSNNKPSGSGRSVVPERSNMRDDRRLNVTAPSASRKRFSSPTRDASRNKYPKPTANPVRNNMQRPIGRSNDKSFPSNRPSANRSEPPRRKPETSDRFLSRSEPTRGNNAPSWRGAPASQARFDQRSKFNNTPSQYSDEEDEYDSMDDFIVSDGEEVPNSLLRKVVRNFCRSDEVTWQQREREIDLSRMEANFHQVATEESRSTRLARLEDMQEEQRGARKL